MRPSSMTHPSHPSRPARVMISCGEASGDLYAGSLAAEIRALEPDADIWGLGGEKLREAGGMLVGDYRGLAVTGLTEALAVLPRSFAVYRRLIARARAERPDVLVAIDYPDFNFRLGAAARRLGIPVVYYVPPQLWAWRAGRMSTIKKLAELVLVIFPFEEPLYRGAGASVEFVGHPLLDTARSTEPRRAFLARHGLDPEAPTVALLPGSRPNELRQILPVLADAVPLIAARVPRAQFLVARAPGLSPELFSVLDRAGRRAAVTVESRADDVLASSDVAITASGTATVQAAIHGCPMVIVYRLSPLTYKLGRRFVRVDTYGMVNVIAGSRIVPELIQDDMTAESVAREAAAFLLDPQKAASTRLELGEMCATLGTPGASKRAATAVLRVARKGRLESLAHT
jgi:lipid-A-disaccharide synthase